MAPATRQYIKQLEKEKKFMKSRVPLEGKSFSRFKFVQCALHLDQLEVSGGVVTKISKLKPLPSVKRIGTPIFPLTFKVFRPEVNSNRSEDGNVAFVIDFNRLINRFNKVYDNGISKTEEGWKQSLILSKSSDDLSRYTPLATATPSFKGDIWWQDNLKQNLILESRLKRGREIHDLEIHVNAKNSDLSWLRERWFTECLDHNNCKRHGMFCSNLLDKNSAREVYYS